ncbi:DNA repair protein [Rubellimicrobium rubrum]|uniref:DNA repair protein n=1 Tax=Rubellimicrobium rubrum TaxID=2585369 RepID=UPI00159BE2F2|nr:DNA repair protein [Rubellimicrobium rubrum]
MLSRATMQQLVRVFHVVSLYVLGLAALTMVVTTLLSALGVLPWLTLQASFGEASAPQAGMMAQLGLTVLLVLLVGFFPSSNRVLDLEKSHRNFRMSMQDVANAYHAAHVADRKGVFSMSAEFDAVRERIDYLREHPDLKLLEADILTVAAQMSKQSHRLAEIYNDERVSRAKDFLTQRQAEVEEQQQRIAEALKACREIMRWSSQVELEEAVVASQLQQLDEQLQAALPVLGYSFGQAEPAGLVQGPGVTRPDNLVSLSQRPAAE